MVKAARRATYVPERWVRNPPRANASVYEFDEMPDYMSGDEREMNHVMCPQNIVSK